MANTIEIENLSHRYGRKKVLNDVSLNISNGTVVAVLGENGAGKTTLVKSILGLIRPSSGTVRVLGLDPRKDSLALKKIVGYVPDKPVVQSWMTINQVGWFASAFYPSGYAQRFEKISHSFKLAGNERFGNLSKGMQAKVSLSLALAMNPQLLVLDEPTSGLDLVVRKTFLEEMVDLAAEGKTVWINSHQVSEVERIADWIVVIQNGSVELIGSLEDLKENHQMVTLEVSDPVLPVPQFFLNPNTISQNKLGRQWKLLVKDFEEGRAKELAGSDFEIKDISRPSLEDIYLGYSSRRHPGESQNEDSSSVLQPAIS